MTMNNQNIIQSEIAQNLNRIQNLSRETVFLTQLAQTFHGVDLSDVAYIGVSNPEDAYNEGGRITLSLKDDAKDSKLAHVLARKLSMKFRKEKAYWGESFNLSGETADGLRIEITGYLGTCRIVETEIPLSAEELEAARERALANVKTSRIERTVKCGK